MWLLPFLKNYYSQERCFSLCAFFSSVCFAFFLLLSFSPFVFLFLLLSPSTLISSSLPPRFIPPLDYVNLLLHSALPLPLSSQSSLSLAKDPTSQLYVSLYFMFSATMHANDPLLIRCLLILKSRGNCSKMPFQSLKEGWQTSRHPHPSSRSQGGIMSKLVEIFKYNFLGFIYSAPDRTDQAFDLKQFSRCTESLCFQGACT